MTSRRASRPAPPPRSLGHRRRSPRVTSGRRAVCARRSHLSPPARCRCPRSRCEGVRGWERPRPWPPRPRPFGPGRSARIRRGRSHPRLSVSTNRTRAARARRRQVDLLTRGSWARDQADDDRSSFTHRWTHVRTARPLALLDSSPCSPASRKWECGRVSATLNLHSRRRR